MGKSSRKAKMPRHNTANDAITKSLYMPNDRKLLGARLIQRTRTFQYFIAGIISLTTLLAYLPSLWNGFVWDDEEYVNKNLIIQSFNFDLIKSAFLDFREANWHPLTWISHAIDYAIWGVNPVGHHLTNVILHALNTAVLVFIVIQMLSIYRSRTEMQTASPWLTERGVLITAGVTSLLFGLHPIHVESVAWVAERKDLLCAFFFLLTMLAYTKYVNVIDNASIQKTVKIRFLREHYLFALGFFILALLSKPMAVSLPIVLLILDWYPFKRIHSVKNLWPIFYEKIPFFSLSLISSIITILAQKAGHALTIMETVPLSKRLLVAVKSLIAYLLKIILPTNLIPFYPYPKDISLLSLEYPLTIILAVGITVICIVRASRERFWLSLWFYYIVTLIPVIGIIQVGAQAMADRYTYLPSLGPFLMMGLVMAWSWNRVDDLRIKRAIKQLFAISAFMILSVAMTYLTVEQIGMWKDDITFWSYVIEKEPYSASFVYNNRGIAFDKMGRFDKAIADFQNDCDLGDRDGCNKLWISRH